MAALTSDWVPQNDPKLAHLVYFSGPLVEKDMILKRLCGQI